jgi:hypothetical protein
MNTFSLEGVVGICTVRRWYCIDRWNYLFLFSLRSVGLKKSRIRGHNERGLRSHPITCAVTKVKCITARKALSVLSFLEHVVLLLTSTHH